MRLYELAFCCYVYGGLEGGYDAATIELREATGSCVDPGNDDHFAPLFHWLRRWGCRQFKINDESVAHESLWGWWRRWEAELPGPDRTLDELDDAALGQIADAYDDLRARQASWQERAGSAHRRGFGPAGAAKTLYAIRPNACSPWDEPIRKRLGFGEDGSGYRDHLRRAREELAEAVADLDSDADASELPRLLERPLSSPVKLVDEHDWVRHTRGFTPPAPEMMMQWSSWASDRRG
jgi:hypothetical protein